MALIQLSNDIFYFWKNPVTLGLYFGALQYINIDRESTCVLSLKSKTLIKPDRVYGILPTRKQEVQFRLLQKKNLHFYLLLNSNTLKSICLQKRALESRWTLMNVVSCSSKLEKPNDT